MMLIPHPPNHGQRGNILLIAMGTVVVLGIALASILSLAVQEQRILARTTAWNAALPVAEAGIEEALSHLCCVKSGSRATNGWSGSSTNFVLTRTNLTDSRFVVAMDNQVDPWILSSGSVWCPSAGRFIARTVEVRAKKSPEYPPGLISKTKTEVQNQARADSYNSASSLYSTAGKYDATKFNDQSMVGSMQGNVMVKDSAKVYGSIGSDTGSFTVVSPAKVGTKAWVASGSSGLQSGHSTMDLAMSFPTVPVPTSSVWISSIPSSGILSNANYSVSSYTGNKHLIVKGKVMLYCTSEFHPTDGTQVTIEAGGKLELYFGSQFYAEGNVTLNVNGKPEQLAIFGVTPGAAEIYIQGNANVVGTIYAPSTKMYLQGTSHFSGAGACNDLVFQGDAQFHYDEALSTAQRTPYVIIAWQER